MFVSDSRQPPASHDLLKLFRMPIKKDGGDDDSSVLLHCVWWWKRDCESAAFLLLLVSGFVYLLAAIDVVVCFWDQKFFSSLLDTNPSQASEGTFVPGKCSSSYVKALISFYITGYYLISTQGFL